MPGFYERGFGRAGAATQLRGGPMGYDILALERFCLTALPAPRQAFIGPFVVKGFLGGTGRGNAASALDPAPLAELPGVVARVEQCFATMGLRPRFRCTPLDPAGLDPFLRARGYVETEESLVMAGPLAPVAAPDAAVRDEGGPSEAWMAMVATAEYQVPARQAEKLRNPDLLAAAGAWLLLREEGVDAACLFAVAEGPFCGFFDLVTRPEFRRRGLAARLIRAAAHWAAARGAEVLTAQVATTNAPSIALQESLGLRAAYRYRYLLAPG
ncbi:GNAT family N-acetyltransferase [Siccirubricoccus sp. KC 17139]|uniref:GNAT family N-acetyltransferase n=1 Tax=Siccirubricoccus soli TaxID=2899147 RepID=A0ABT1D057_9PROT|nr:GNAT family N-acetyltransferase [Siccirubricoccus soli]MCO6415303.1 GNAT family N-acetyltransferase [Siccirubricoccus soli]MCP2681434.1 GNAT family N-acetyltransferase [Siccirubricoccus soli]